MPPIRTASPKSIRGLPISTRTSAEARAARILAGLGFDAEAQARPCSAFSGGWRMRVALAGVLFAEPDLLLLDEPTNYLDLEGTLWLERYLARYPHTVVVISHDRDLLNSAVDCIVHLSERRLTLWRGGYDSFERQYREKRILQEAQRKKQETERKHMQAFVDRFRAKATKARQAQSRLKALARLQPIAAVTQESVAPFASPSRSGDFPRPSSAWRTSRSATRRDSRCSRASISGSTTTTASRCWARTATASPPSPSWWRRC